MLLGRDRAGLNHALYVGYLRFVKPRPSLDTPSEVRVDVIIVAHEKDLDPLPFTISAIKRFLLHPIGRVYIVAADSPRLRQLCREYQCEFVDEDTILPIAKGSIRYIDRSGRDRSGWLFQQLLKLSADTIAREERCYVIDADTVLVRPCALKRRGRTVVFCTDRQYHEPYYHAFRKLLRDDRRFPASFVCHQMLFENSRLREMKTLIERAAAKPWYSAICDAVDTSEPSCFSEYETYGNFLAANYPEEIDVQYFCNLSLPVRELKRLTQFEQMLSPRHQSISFHSYLS
jgi:hypothetical protein